jgi:hypothetical protein
MVFVGWWCGVNVKSACLATVRPEFKPQYHKKKKKDCIVFVAIDKI